MKAFQRCLDPEMVHHCWIPTVDLSSWENQRNWVCEVELRGCGLNSSLGYQTWCHIVNFHVTLKMVKNLPANARRHRRPGFNPWVRKIPWRRAWQPTPIFLPEESHGQRSLAGCSPRLGKDLDMTERLTHTCFFSYQGQRNMTTQPPESLLSNQEILTSFYI